MGLFGFAGKVIGGVLKVGVGVAGAVVGTAVKTAVQANNVRNNSGHMSEAELLVRSIESKSVAERAGYAQAFKDRQGR